MWSQMNQMPDAGEKVKGAADHPRLMQHLGPWKGPVGTDLILPLYVQDIFPSSVVSELLKILIAFLQIV